MTPSPSPLRPDLFQGEVVVVSGAAGGIGRAVSAAFRSHGAWVLGLDLGWQEGWQGCDEQIAVDLCNPSAVATALDVVAPRGGIDVLVHCAAIYRREKDPDRADPMVWGATLDTNVRGMLTLDRAALPWLSFGARIVHVSSVRSRTAARGAVAYSVSKAMVDQATQVLALEWAGRGIRVNAVAPGDIETPMNPNDPGDEAQAQLLARCPMARMGQPEEVAGAILFLCSPLASFVHGATLRVDGGFLVQ